MAKRKPFGAAASLLGSDDQNADLGMGGRPQFLPSVMDAVSGVAQPKQQSTDQQRYAASDALLASHGMAPHVGGRQTIGPGNMARGKNAPPSAGEMKFLHALFGAIRAGGARRA